MLNRNGEWILTEDEMGVFYRALKHSDPTNLMVVACEEEMEERKKVKALEEEFKEVLPGDLVELLSKDGFQKGERYAIGSRLFEALPLEEGHYGNCRDCSLSLLCQVNNTFCREIKCRWDLKVYFKEVAE